MRGLVRERYTGSGILLAALCGLVGAVLILVSFQYRRVIGFSIAGSLVLVLGAYLSGNHRLYCLWGLLLTSPIDLSKRFMPLRHMGGEAAFRIEASDFFLLPLLFFLLRDLARGRERPPIRIPLPMVLWMAAGALGLMNVVMGPWRTAAAHEMVRMLKVTLIGLVIVNEILRRRQVQHVVMGLMTGVVLESLVGLAQYAFNMRFGLQVLGEVGEVAAQGLNQGTLEGKVVHRVSAFLSHPNVFAAYLAFLLPTAIALLFTRISAPFKALCIAAAVLGEAALIVTLSRSGWVSFAAAFLLVIGLSFLNAQMRRRFVMARVLLIGAAVVVGIVFSGPIIDRLTLSDPGALSLRWRLVGDAWRMIEDKPILGHGLNAYVYAMPPYTQFGSLAGVVRNYGDFLPAVHNIYLLWWSEQGIVGLLLYLGVFAALFRIGYLNLRIRDEMMFAISIGAVCGLVALSIDGIFSFTIRINMFLRVFWILSGLMIAVHYWHLREERDVVPVREASEPAAA